MGKGGGDAGPADETDARLQFNKLCILLNFEIYSLCRFMMISNGEI